MIVNTAGEHGVHRKADCASLKSLLRGNTP